MNLVIKVMKRMVTVKRMEYVALKFES